MGKFSVPRIRFSVENFFFRFGKWSNYNLETCSECKQANYGDFDVIERKFGTKLLQINLTSELRWMETNADVRLLWVCIWRSLNKLKQLGTQLNYCSEHSLSPDCKAGIRGLPQLKFERLFLNHTMQAREARIFFH